MERILEEHLYLPALYLISLNDGEITTTELSQQLRILLDPKGEDLTTLDNRTDDKFSQIVRNLTAAERSFVKNDYINREKGRNKPLSVAKNGKEFLKNNYEFLKYIFENNFDFKDVIESFQSANLPENKDKKVSFFDENIIILEGVKKIKEEKIYQRSVRLRNKAIEKYTVDGKIKCNACYFDFGEFYGQYGKGFIEIHHEKPVYTYQDNELEKTLINALENVVPVCPNCHRMIHRNRTTCLTVQDLKDKINKDLIFCNK